MDRLSVALAGVQLLGMPESVMAVVEAANDYVVELGDERTDELVARWPSIREELLDVVRLLDPEPHRWWRVWLRRGDPETGRPSRVVTPFRVAPVPLNRR